MLYLLKEKLKKTVRRIDRRCRFRDLAAIPPNKRIANSKVLHIYSSVNNIGNYLPILGIWELLDNEFDTWNIHDPEIDFDFINKNYKGIIVGGAGLLCKCFTPFWQKLQKRGRLPIELWGLGGCFADIKYDDQVSPDILNNISNIDLINIRDTLTANYYSFDQVVSITPCPSVAWVRKFKKKEGGTKAIYSAHDELISDFDKKALYKMIERNYPGFAFTNNKQTFCSGIKDIVIKYANSSIVLTTRLHGAIIAYALEIPYIAYARDHKLRDFNKLFGNGICVDTLKDFEQLLYQRQLPSINKKVKIEDIEMFSQMAKNWLNCL